MTFQTQLTADLAVFFNPDEFGRAATYTPVSGSAVTTTIMIEEGAGMQENVVGINPAAVGKAWVKLSAVASPKQHDTITIGARTWSVIEELSRDESVAVLLIANKERLEC